MIDKSLERYLFCIFGLLGYIYLILIYVFGSYYRRRILYKNTKLLNLHIFGGTMELLIGGLMLYYTFYQKYLVFRYLLPLLVLTIHVPTNFLLLNQVLGIKRISQPSYFIVGILLIYFSYEMLNDINNFDKFLQLFSLILMAVCVRYVVLICYMFNLSEGLEYTIGIMLSGFITLSVVMGTIGIIIPIAVVILWNIIFGMFMKCT